MSLNSAFIHIDLDGFWSHLGYYGISHPMWPDPVYSEALPRWLDLLKEFNIKATFFVIGRDMEVKEKVVMIKKIFSEGHEIANHSYSHNIPLASISKKEKQDEIIKTHKVLADITGSPPKGFRAPSFSLDDDVLDILEEEGYLYDSSLFSSPYGKIVQTILNKIGSSRHKGKNLKKSETYGEFMWAFAPLEPYKPRKGLMWKKGGREIWEIPVSSMPLLKLPFHYSYILAMQSYSYRIAEMYCNAGITFSSFLNRPLLYLFHGLELADPNSIQEIEFQPGTKVPINQKIKGVESILERIRSKFHIVRLNDYLIGKK